MLMHYFLNTHVPRCWDVFNSEVPLNAIAIRAFSFKIAVCFVFAVCKKEFLYNCFPNKVELVFFLKRPEFRHGKVYMQHVRGTTLPAAEDAPDMTV